MVPAVLSAGCSLLADILLRRFCKIPFACAYPAWKQGAAMIAVLYLIGLWVFAVLLPRLEHALLLKSAWNLWVLALALLPARFALRRLHDQDETNRLLVFEEVSDSPFELLNLSGR